MSGDVASFARSSDFGVMITKGFLNWRTICRRSRWKIWLAVVGCTTCMLLSAASCMKRSSRAELCSGHLRANDTETLLGTLYADDASSVEALAMPEMPQAVHGRDAIRQKGEWWFANHEIHAFTIEGPWPHGDRFVVTFDIDVTNKPSGQRVRMKEAGVFTVRDGKIAKEEFFYGH